MKKTIIGLTLFALLVVPLAASASIWDIIFGGGENTVEGPPAMTGDDLIEALQRLTNWLFTILLIVAVIFIIIAGFYFVTAQGDPEKVHRARNFVLWALVGVGVAVASVGLVALVRLIITGA